MALTLNGSTGITVVDGSSSAPSVVGSDSNTGLSFAADTVNINTGGSTRAKIDSYGRMSIGGSTDVNQLLHVENASGDAFIRIRGSVNKGVALNNSSGDLMGIFCSGGAVNLQSNDVVIGSYISGAKISFQTGTANAAGEVVHINSGGMMAFDGKSGTPWGATFRSDADDANNSVRMFFEGTNGQANRTFSVMSENGKYRISGGGVAGSSTGSQLVYLSSTTATSWSSGSDERLKENITEIPSVLNKIKNYRCARFNFKGDDASDIENIKFGFIAQDWVADFPEVISSSTINADDPTDTTEYYGMQYTETIPILLKAIQELTAKVEALEAA